MTPADTPIALRANRFPHKINTAISPEDYAAVKELAGRLGITAAAVLREALRPGLRSLLKRYPKPKK